VTINLLVNQTAVAVIDVAFWFFSRHRHTKRKNFKRNISPPFKLTSHSLQTIWDAPGWHCSPRLTLQYAKCTFNWKLYDCRKHSRTQPVGLSFHFFAM